MKQTSRTARRLLAVPVVIATALSVGPGLTGIAQAAPPTGSFLNPSTTGPGSVISDKLDGTNGTYRFLVRATDPDVGGGIASVQIQTEDGDADATFETIGTATQVGTTDTYEFQWDVSAYTPASDVDNDPGFVRALVTDNNAETSFIGTATGQAATFLDSTSETASITSPTNGGTLGFFPTTSAHTGLIAGTASAGATSVAGFYTTSAAGATPTWTACGTDAAPAAATGGTKTFSINCDIGTGTVAANVTAVAVRVNGTDSGDAVRVTGYGQTLQSFTITPTSDNQTVGFCNTYAVVIVDQNGRAIAGAPVQVQVKGTNAGANASATDPDLQDVIKFAQNNAAEGTSSDAFLPAGGTTETTHRCDVLGEPDGAADDVDGANTGPNESVLAGGASDDIAATKAITGTTAGNGQFKFSLSLLSSDTAAVGTYNISAFLDANGNNTQQAGEVGNTATKTYQTATATTLTATPASATNVVGEVHTVTGMLVDQNGNPMAGQTLTFRVTSGPHANSDLDANPSTPNGIFGQGPTGTDGKVSKSYTGTAAGTDTIVVFQDANSNLTPDPTEKQASVSKTWVSTTSASCIDLDPNDATNPTTAAHEIRAYVTDGTYDVSGDDDKTDAGAARENDCGGNPVAGVPVDFTITGGPAATLSPDTNGNTQTERVFTDANGVARITLNKTDPTTNGINTVGAVVPGGATASTYSAKSIPLNFEDISTTGTQEAATSNCDDCGSPALPLPFTFTYYGAAKNSVYISSNGFLSFNNSALGDYTPDPDYPNSNTPNDIIGGFWTDLDSAVAGDVRYQTLGVAPNRRFIVMYNGVANYSTSGGNLATFEIKLFEGTNRIEVHYLSAEASSNASVGIENSGGTVGTTYLASTPQATLSNQAVQFTPGQTSVSKRWEVAGSPTKIVCTPADARNVVGQTHNVTCTVTDFFGTPVAGKQVTFRVIFGPHADNDLDSNPSTTPGYFGTGVTNSSGVVSASYVGSDTTPNNGLDVIDGFLDANTNQVDDNPTDATQTTDSNGNGIIDAGDQTDMGELSSFANKGWSTASQVQGANVELDVQPTNNTGNDTPSGTANTANCDADLAGGYGGATWNSTTSGTIGFTEIVCVSSKDVNGNILIGQNVTLTSSGVGQVTDSKGANGTASKTAAIGSKGYAVFYISSSQTGTQNLVASAAGTTDTDSGSKTWTSLAARRVAIANVGGTTATPGGTHQVKITVTDSQGNPVPGANLTVTETGPGRFVAGPSTEPSSINVTTGSDGTVTVELQSLSTESGTETVTAALSGLNPGPNNDECERAAGDPTGAPVGVCSASTSFTWTNGGTSTTFKILSPSSYYTTIAGGTYAQFSGVGGAPGEVLTVHRKIGNGSYTTLAGPTVGSDGTWIYSLRITTTTAVFFTGANGTTATKVFLTTLNITYPSTYYFDVTKGQRVAVYGSGARPGAVLEIWTKTANQSDYVRRTNTVTATSYGTWALRFNVYTTIAIYFRGVNGKSDAVVFRAH